MPLNFQINSPDDIIQKVDELGFLPFFANKIPGFSIEEHTPPTLWYCNEDKGSWEWAVWKWKGPIITQQQLPYGKFLNNKALFVSHEWFPHLVNAKRNTAPLSYDEQNVLTAITSNESLLTTEIREYCGFAHKQPSLSNDLLPNQQFKSPSLDSILTRLQMACQIIISNFEYKIDKHGKPYGWGVARYSTPEIFFADWFELPQLSPQESATKIFNHLTSLFPSVNPKLILKFISR